MDARIVLLPGDGIGPEIVTQAKRVLESVATRFGHSFEMPEHLIGGLAILASIAGVIFVNMTNLKPASALMGGVLFSGVLCALMFYPVTTSMFPDGLKVTDILSGGTQLFSAGQIYFAAVDSRYASRFASKL